MVAVAASAVTLTVTLGVWLNGQGNNKLLRLENLLVERFVDGADRQALQDAAAEAMVEQLDRWSDYIPASESEDYADRKNNAYVGIGVTLQDAESYYVGEVAEGGPAQKVGIQVGDLLIAADGQPLENLPVSEGRNLIRGKEGTTVEITVLRQGQEMTFTVTRATIKTLVATGQLLQDGIGLVTINNFNAGCMTQTKAAIDSLLSQGATALIFDVRDNPGGYASEMVDVLDYLLPEGLELFRTMDYQGKETVEVAKDGHQVELPMAVLVNGSSYSAAEFFAAVLQEYDRAIVVGERTSGKGYYQVTYELGDGSAVALSVGKYITPKGISLEGVGITPDILAEKDEAEADNPLFEAINALKSANNS